jgi:GNAT superfamily N-acetyltransferase
MKETTEDSTNIALVRTDEEIESCFSVMRELRTQLVQSEFVQSVQRLEKGGFRLAFLKENGQIKAVAGFRVTENLDNSRFMYVEDLVTTSVERSKSYGQQLFDWLFDFARLHNCRALTLDSGVQRFEAHRFYLRNRMRISSHHFWLAVSAEPGSGRSGFDAE